MNQSKISTILFLFALLVSERVFSQTNYDFSQTFSYAGGPNVTLTGSFTTGAETVGIGSYLITGWSNLSFGGYPTSPTTSTTAKFGLGPDLGSYNPTKNIFTDNTGWRTYSHATFTFTASSAVDGYTDWSFIGMAQNMNNTMNSIDACSGSCITNATIQSYSQVNNAVITLNSSAPEIDGSLAPQVGFLLGCLFLMFGRNRKELHLNA